MLRKYLLKLQSQKLIKKLVSLFIKLINGLVYKNKLNHIELVQLILEDSKYIEYLELEEKNLKNPNSLNRLENIKEFIASLNDFENLEGFLEHVSLVMENISNVSDETITLMTMHGAKGLEFDYVFLAGWEEGVFPSKRSIEEVWKNRFRRREKISICSAHKSS